jgi:hypothetical protein
MCEIPWAISAPSTTGTKRKSTKGAKAARAIMAMPARSWPMSAPVPAAVPVGITPPVVSESPSTRAMATKTLAKMTAAAVSANFFQAGAKPGKIRMAKTRGPVATMR